MDVTLRSYMGLRSDDAWTAITESLDELRQKAWRCICGLAPDRVR